MKKIALLLSLILLFTATACHDSHTGTSDGELIPVTLNEVAHSIFYAPQYVAIENGYFEEEGIDLTLVTGFGVLNLAQTF